MIAIQSENGELVKILKNVLDGEFGFHRSFGVISKDSANKRIVTRKRNHYDYTNDEWLCSFKIHRDEKALKVSALNGCEAIQTKFGWELKTPNGIFNVSEVLTSKIPHLLENNSNNSMWLSKALKSFLVIMCLLFPIAYYMQSDSKKIMEESTDIVEPITIQIPKEIKMVRVVEPVNYLTTPNMSPTLVGKAEFSRRAVSRNLGFLGMVGSQDVKNAIGGVPQHLKVATAGAGAGGTGGSGGETLTGLGKGLRRTTVGNTGVQGLGGIGTKGGAGGGLGGYGNTLVASGEGKGISAIAVSNSDMMVEGGISKYAINATIAKYLNQVRRCYETELKNRPELQGLVEMSFEINAEGRLNFSKVNKSTLESPPVENCISAKMLEWQFPKPKGGVSVPVKYPFMLRPVGN